MPVVWKLKDWLAANRNIHSATEFHRHLLSAGANLSLPAATTLYNKPPLQLKMETAQMFCNALNCTLEDFCQVIPDQSAPQFIRTEQSVEGDSPSYRRGVLLCAEGRHEQAIPHLEAHLKEYPKDLRAITMLAHSKAGAGDFRGAYRACERALVFDPDNPRLLYLQGHILLKRRKPAEAVLSLQRAVGLAPHFAAAAIELGIAYRRAGRLEKALETLKDLVRRFPEEPRAHSVLVVTLGKAGRDDEATTHMETLKKSRPDLHSQVEHLKRKEAA